jgi:hypothetical protein
VYSYLKSLIIKHFYTLQSYKQRDDSTSQEQYLANEVAIFEQVELDGFPISDYEDPDIGCNVNYLLKNSGKSSNDSRTLPELFQNNKKQRRKK